MPRWKELPDELTTSEQQLLVQLRRLKDHSGLSLAALAGRTSYSRSSWERYLNGKKPVPRKAVEELAEVCGTEPTRLVVLFDVAERARAKEAGRTDGAPQGRSSERETAEGTGSAKAPDAEAGAGKPVDAEPVGAQTPDAKTVDAQTPDAKTVDAQTPDAKTVDAQTPDAPTPDAESVDAKTVDAGAPVAEQREGARPPEPEPAPSRDGGPRRNGRTVPLGWAVGTAVVAVAAAFGAGMLTGGARGGADAPEARPSGVVAAGAGYLRGRTYPCAVRREHRELRAGHSDTREMLLDINSTGFDVVEAQCLLREKGFDPGATDGLYDERAKGAAKKFQQARRLVVDGIIGQDTWRELRR
ncbi:helix-turn-helix domain-containing protein [Streptomyces sp. NPDC058195]|uniref:helix-turn-helix domain-containing protein n=1 Tax=Streptomyces sp. NPDC058195 TaxID=3346375 RepID=UPI0036EFE97C